MNKYSEFYHFMQFLMNSKPPVELVVCTYPRRVRLPAHPSTGIEVWQRITISGSRYVAAVFFCLLILATRKRVYVLAYADLVCHSVILELGFYILAYYSFISSDHIHVIPSAPKIPASVLIF